MRAQIYIVGPAAMSLAFSRDRTTEDVDARFDTGHCRLTEAVRTVGRRRGLAGTWLGELATAASSRGADGGAPTLYESPQLTVTGASVKHVLAMKLLAGRDRDREDIAALCEQLGLEGPEEALGVYRELFPKESVKPTARKALETAFRDRHVGTVHSRRRGGTPYFSIALENRSVSASHVHVRKGKADTGVAPSHITMRLESPESIAASASRSAGSTAS